MIPSIWTGRSSAARPPPLGAVFAVGSWFADSLSLSLSLCTYIYIYIYTHAYTYIGCGFSVCDFLGFLAFDFLVISCLVFLSLSLSLYMYTYTYIYICTHTPGASIAALPRHSSRPGP